MTRMGKPLEASRNLGAETARGHVRRLQEGFYAKYLAGSAVLDIGYRGGKADAVPVTDAAIGVELDYPGYDGVHLPFEDGSQDAVFASHTLEHIEDPQQTLAEWFRVLRIGGYLIIAVPHQWLYERRAFLPSRFNGDHKRFYTPASLMAEVEGALPVGEWRLRSLRDSDDGFDYSRPPEQHPTGSYEIEIVVEKIARPAYADRLTPRPHALTLIRVFAELLVKGAAASDKADAQSVREILVAMPLPHYRLLLPHVPAGTDIGVLKAYLQSIVAKKPFDEEDYLARYSDIRRAVDAGTCKSGFAHYCAEGYFRGRTAAPVPKVFR